MLSQKTHPTGGPSGDAVTPFSSTEEAWFWFVQAYKAHHEGAKITKGIGETRRPCEPVDILTILDRLYRSRRLLIDHLRVLQFYGLRHTAPDPDRKRETRAHHLWQEAIKRLEDSFIRKGIVHKKPYGVYHV